VHQISPTFLPLSVPEQPTFLLAYRNFEDVVHFWELTPLTYQLLQLVETESGQFSETYLTQLVTLAPTFSVQKLKEAGLEILRDFVQRGVIVSA
jgi:hypothetical protein